MGRGSGRGRTGKTGRGKEAQDAAHKVKLCGREGGICDTKEKGSAQRRLCDAGRVRVSAARIYDDATFVVVGAEGGSIVSWPAFYRRGRERQKDHEEENSIEMQRMRVLREV